MLTSIDEADQMARYELGKRKDPRVSCANCASTPVNPAQALARALLIASP